MATQQWNCLLYGWIKVKRPVGSRGLLQRTEYEALGNPLGLHATVIQAEIFSISRWVLYYGYLDIRAQKVLKWLMSCIDADYRMSSSVRNLAWASHALQGIKWYKIGYWRDIKDSNILKELTQKFSVKIRPRQVNYLIVINHRLDER